MEKSFKKQMNDKDNENSTPEADAQLLADIEGYDNSNLPAVQGNNMPMVAIGSVIGDSDPDDLVFPYLQLVYGTSKVPEEYGPGDFLLNKDTLVASKGEAVSFIALSIRKYYMEYIPYGTSDVFPRTFATRKELVDAGLWTDWRNDERPPAVEAADLLMLIKQPEGVDSPAFAIEAAGDRYAIARWQLKSISVYKAVAKTIFSKLAIELRIPGILGGDWEMHSERRTFGGNSVPVPVVRLAGVNPPEKINAILAAVGAPTS
jgi:hypothetical protein